MFVINPYRFGSAASTANAVTFDGTNDSMAYASDLTGISDGEACTVSFWIRTSSINKKFFAFSTQNELEILSSGKLTWPLLSTAGGVNKILFTTNAAINGGTWTHVLISLEANSTSTRFVYINDSLDSTTWTTYSAADLIDWTRGSMYFVENTGKITADFADFYFSTSYIDISVEANRRKFITADGAPAARDANGGYGGADIPLIWFSGATDNWHTNKGTGGGFTLTGTLTTSAHLPVEV